MKRHVDTRQQKTVPRKSDSVIEKGDEYKPKGPVKKLGFEVLPKKLRNRVIPGFNSSLSPITEDIPIPPYLPAHQISNPSTLEQTEVVPDAFHVDQDTIQKLEDDLHNIKLTLKRDPDSKNWVSYKSIEKFSDAED